MSASKQEINVAVKNSEISLDISADPLEPDVQEENIFEDPDVRTYWYEVYEKSKYECRHLIDHTFTWTKAEEKVLLQKTEWRVTFWTFIMLVSLEIDRVNLSQANSNNFLEDLGLTTDDYNLGNTVNLISFLGAELPSQLISKRIGPDKWLPIQLVLWSAVAMSQAGLKGKAGFLITRCLIGALQGGFIPDVCLWMSYFHTKKELASRLCWFYVANPATMVVSSIAASGVLKITGGEFGKQSWRWLFLIEGLITLIVGLVGFLRMPASAVQTKRFLSPNGWYTDREEKIMVNRIVRDDPSKGDMHNREALSLKLIWKSFMDYDVWPIYLVRLFSDIGVAPVSTYLTLTLRHLGFSTFNTNLLTAAPNLLKTFFFILQGFVGYRITEYSLFFLAAPLWYVPCLFALRFWPGSQVHVWPTYAILTLAIGAPAMTALSVSWCSANSNSVRTRTVSSALVNMFGQAAGVMTANMYRADDAPLYHRGNQQLIAIGIATIVLLIGTRFYYDFRNKQNARKWNAMTKEEQDVYRKTTTDEGNKRLDFFFTH